VVLEPGDLTTTAEDIEGWMVETAGSLTVALDTTLDDGLRREGLAREVVNRVQNLRKDRGLEVTDRIRLGVSGNDRIWAAVDGLRNAVSEEVLAREITLETEGLEHTASVEIDGETCTIGLSKAED